MSCDGWSRGPFGLDARKGATLTARRTVLVVAHHLTAATRLADVVPLVGRDRRIQTVWTVAPSSVLAGGADEHLRACGHLVIPFGQATQLPFDLAVAAGNGGLEQLHAPVLHLQHGMGPAGVLSHRWKGAGPAAPRPVAGLRREAIVSGGRVIPAAIGLAHHEHGRRLAEVCPEAAPVVRVTGDVAYDRLVTSLPGRDRYRRALGVADGRRLVVVSSTWGPRALLGRHHDLLRRLACELPRERYAIVAVLHPVIWSWHGRTQTLAWFDDCLRLGVRILPPEEGWRAALAAADLVIGDHGSVTYYAGTIAPVMLASFPDEDVLPGSQAGLLGDVAPRLSPDRPLLGQVERCLERDRPQVRTLLRDHLTSEPGRAAVLLRRLMYELMGGLDEPAEPPPVDPVPLPEPIGHPCAEVYR